MYWFRCLLALIALPTFVAQAGAVEHSRRGGDRKFEVVGVLSAETVVKLALAQDPQIRAELDRLGIADAEFLESTLLKNPTFEGMARFPNQPADLAAALVEEITAFLTLHTRKAIAREKLAAAEGRVASRVLMIVGEATECFYRAVAAHALLEEENRRKEEVSAALELSRLQREAGNISELDLVLAQAAVAEAEVAVDEANADAREWRIKLARKIGALEQEERLKLPERLPSPPEDDRTLSHVVLLALERRPDLRAAGKEAEAGAAMAAFTRKYRWLGQIEAGVSTERDASNDLRTGPTLRLEPPIFDHGQARIARTEGEANAAADERSALELDIRAEVRELYGRMNAERAAAVIFREQLIPERKRVLELTLLHYNAMFVGAYDLLQARQQLTGARRGYLEALRNYWLTRNALERATGEIVSTRMLDEMLQRRGATHSKP